MRVIFLCSFLLFCNVAIFAQQKITGHWRVNGVVKNKTIVLKVELFNLLEKSNYSVDTSKKLSDSTKKVYKENNEIAIESLGYLFKNTITLKANGKIIMEIWDTEDGTSIIKTGTYQIIKKTNQIKVNFKTPKVETKYIAYKWLGKILTIKTDEYEVDATEIEVGLELLDPNPK